LSSMPLGSGLACRLRQAADLDSTPAIGQSALETRGCMCQSGCRLPSRSLDLGRRLGTFEILWALAPLGPAPAGPWASLKLRQRQHSVGYEIANVNRWIRGSRLSQSTNHKPKRLHKTPTQATHKTQATTPDNWIDT
jgi:hypothetical protein